MPVTRVGVGHPKCGHPTTAERADRVERLAGGDARVAPRGPGADVARALDDDRDVCPEDVLGRQQPGVQRHGLVLAAVGLPDRHGAGQPALLGQRRDVAREREGQRPTVGHEVDHPGLRPVEADAGQHRGQGGVQVGDHDGQALEVAGCGQRSGHDVVVRAVLLVHGHEHLLLRCVPRLDDVPVGALRVGRQPVGRGHDEGQSTGPEPTQQGGGVEQHPVADLGLTDEGGVGERANEVGSVTVVRVSTASRTAYSTAPGQRPRTCSTVPSRHCITTRRLGHEGRVPLG